MPKSSARDGAWHPDSDDSDDDGSTRKSKVSTKPAVKAGQKRKRDDGTPRVDKPKGAARAVPRARKVVEDDDAWDSDAEKEKDRRADKRKKAKVMSMAKPATVPTKPARPPKPAVAKPAAPAKPSSAPPHPAVAKPTAAAATKASSALSKAATAAAKAKEKADKLAAKAVVARLKAAEKAAKAKEKEEKQRKRQQEQEWTASLAARQAKAKKALQEDSFALHALAPKANKAEWQALASLLQTADRSQLGKGKDVTLAFGEYDGLRLASAWRIEHPDNKKKYATAKEHVRKEMGMLERKGVLAASAHMRGLPTASARRLEAMGAPKAFELDKAANETYLLHGTSPAVLQSVLYNGLNERYSGSNAGTAFGDGVRGIGQPPRTRPTSLRVPSDTRVLL